MICEKCKRDLESIFTGVYEGGVWICKHCGIVLVDNGPGEVETYDLHEYRPETQASPQELKTPEEMLDRWLGYQCQCDFDVGHLCEGCHDVQVLRELIKERDQLKGDVPSGVWVEFASDGHKDPCRDGCKIKKAVKEYTDHLCENCEEPKYLGR